jgi:hypothetical protein
MRKLFFTYWFQALLVTLLFFFTLASSALGVAVWFGYLVCLGWLKHKEAGK